MKTQNERRVLSNTREKKHFAQDWGVSVGTINGWINRHWTKGVQYNVVGHTTLIFVEKADKWVREHLSGQLASDRGAKESKSGFGDTGRSTTKKRSRAIPTTRVTSKARLNAVASSSPA